MGRHRRRGTLRVAHRAVGSDVSGRHKRSAWSLPLFAFSAALAFVFVSVIAPDEAPPVAAYSLPHFAADEVQSLSVTGEFSHGVARDGYTVSKKVTALPLATGDAAAAQVIAYEMVKSRGWGDEEFECLVRLWNRESHWNMYAENKSSGAYGIPQALPGSKMASAGADWATNPATQITWGLGYIAGRYGTPCGAWNASETKGWY